MQFITRLGDHPRKDEIITMLQSLSGFGLCRAHAVNLGRLIWALAYQKAHNPEKFWKSCLKHCQGSYKRWVYRTEAKRVGIEVVTPSKSDRWDTPEFQYRHKWRVNDLAVWDNRLSLHYALFDYTQNRLMHRVVIAGDVPY